MTTDFGSADLPAVPGGQGALPSAVSIVQPAPVEIHVFTAAPASSAHRSDDPTDTYVLPQSPLLGLGSSDGVSIVAVWSGLTGVLGGTVVFEVTNDPLAATSSSTANYFAKAGNSIALNSASGAAEMNFSGAGFLSEKYMRLRSTVGGITGGTLDVYLRGVTTP